MAQVSRAERVARWFGVGDDWERVPEPGRARFDARVAILFALCAMATLELYRGLGLAAPLDRPVWQQHALLLAGIVPLFWRRRFPLTVAALGQLHFFTVGVTMPQVAYLLVVQLLCFFGLYSGVAWARDRRALLVVLGGSWLSGLPPSLSALFGGRFLVEIDGYVTQKKNFVGPLLIETPLAYLTYDNVLASINALRASNGTVQQAVAAYKTFRDSAIFTTKRLIVRDAQGLRGKKVEIYSLPYSSIHMWSSENAGNLFDVNAELELWTRVGHIKVSLGRDVDVRRLDALIAAHVL